MCLCLTGCPLWEDMEGWTIEPFGGEILIVSCDKTEEFVLLQCQGDRWIQKLPGGPEIALPPC